MLMRIVWGRVKPGTWDKYEDVYKRRLISRTDDVPGLQRRMLVRSAENPDEGYSISFWESQEAIDAYKENPLYKETMQELEDTFEGEWWENLCEVRAEG